MLQKLAGIATTPNCNLTFTHHHHHQHSLVLEFLARTNNSTWKFGRGYADNMDSIKEAARVATSRPVQRAVVNSIFFIISASTLLGLAAVATALFFQGYLPERAVSAPLYLQYGASPNPYAITPLVPPKLKTEQEYDVSVALSMPRSPVNMERGNFMVSLHLMDLSGKNDLDKRARIFANSAMDFGNHKVLFSSRRPALVQYTDPLVSRVSQVLLLAYHILFPTTQSIKLSVKLAERVSFAREALVPASVYVEVEAGQNIQIYSAEIILTAQLRGLRWLMHNYRIVTFTILTVIFWLCEILFMSGAWAVWMSITDTNGAKGGSKRLTEGSESGDHSDDNDDNDDDDSDYDDQQGQSSDQPRRLKGHESQRSLKKDPDLKTEAELERALNDIPSVVGEADDEQDEEDDYTEEERKLHATSIKTGYAEKGKDSVRRRSSKNNYD